MQLLTILKHGSEGVYGIQIGFPYFYNSNPYKIVGNKKSIFDVHLELSSVWSIRKS